MNNNKPEISKSLPFRLLGGGYLLYLAWDLRTAVRQEPAILIAVAVFAVAGAVVLGHSLFALGLFSRDTEPEGEETAELPEHSDD